MIMWVLSPGNEGSNQGMRVLGHYDKKNQRNVYSGIKNTKNNNNNKISIQ
jgi:uncharacterized protein YktA (UPF0223 family)